MGSNPYDNLSREAAICLRELIGSAESDRENKIAFAVKVHAFVLETGTKGELAFGPLIMGTLSGVCGGIGHAYAAQAAVNGFNNDRDKRAFTDAVVAVFRKHLEDAMTIEVVNGRMQMKPV